MRVRGAVAALAWLPIIGAVACERGPRLDTRTFELEYMNPGEAVEMVRPYVYGERERNPGIVSSFASGITVRETAENLERIATVLEEYDVATPAVRLHFQLIEADGFAGTDERIADVQGALENLFRFDGYRLVTEAQIVAMEGSGSSQLLTEGNRQFMLETRVEEVRNSGATGSVVLSVDLSGNFGRIETAMAVRVGRTIVLGSAKARAEPTMILTVRPEFVPITN